METARLRVISFSPEPHRDSLKFLWGRRFTGDNKCLTRSQPQLVAKKSTSKPANSPNKPTAPSPFNSEKPSSSSPPSLPPKAKPGQDFFPLTVDYRERAAAAGQVPRRLLQARRPPDRKRNSHLPSHRSPDSSALSQRLVQRSPGAKHSAQRGRRKRSGHPEHHRRIGRADGQRHSVGRPAWARAAWDA